MKFNIASSLFFFCLVIALVSCNSDDDAKPADKCRPRTVWAYGDSVVYDYAASGKLSRIVYYSSRILYKVETLDYDSKQRLSKFTRKYALGTVPFQTVEITYGADDKPERMDTWGEDLSISPVATNFTHDPNGRLSTKTGGSFGIIYRYEYDNSNNVVKIFHKDISSGTEVLARENPSFDTHKRFYANVAELKIVYEYIFNFEPSQHNSATAIIYYAYPKIQLVTPANATFTLAYDDNGMITAKDNLLTSDIGEFNFNYFRYTCE